MVSDNHTVIDVRGPRFSAALTFCVLAAAFLLQSVVLVGMQVAVFGVAALAGLRYSLYGNLFRFLKRRLDLGPPPATEPEAGPRFSQSVGLVVTVAAVVALTLGAATVGWGLVLLVMTLSGLLAGTGLCVGCELYAIGHRLRILVGRNGTPGHPAADASDLAALIDPAASLGLVEFTTPGCAGCAKTARVLAEVVTARPQASVVVLDVGEHIDLASAHRIMRAPTTMVVSREGHLLGRVSGVPIRDALVELIDRAERDGVWPQTSVDQDRGVLGGRKFQEVR